jgi:hypothetical protein
VIAAILLLAGLGVVLWNLLADDPDAIETLPDVSTTLFVEPTATGVQTTLPAPGTTAEGTLPERPPLTIAPTVPGAAGSTAPDTIPAPAATGAPVPVTTARPAPQPTAAPATNPPQTAPAETAPAETAPLETAPPATAPPPPPPSPPAGSAGDPQALDDPLPSGAGYGSVRESHLLSPRLADALAAEDWNAARRLSPALASSSDESLRNGYGGLDRASLILVDAREEGDSTRLLIVSVANELNGSRTSLYCFEWTAQPGAGTVRQGGGVGRIARADGALSPDDVRADERLEGAIRNDCVWS